MWKIRNGYAIIYYVNHHFDAHIQADLLQMNARVIRNLNSVSQNLYLCYNDEKTTLSRTMQQRKCKWQEVYFWYGESNLDRCPWIWGSICNIQYGFCLMIFVKNHALGNAIVSSLNHIAIFRIKVAQCHTLRYMVFKLLWSKY